MMQFVQSRFLSQLLVVVLFWPERIWKVVYPAPHAGRLPESLDFPLCVLHNPLFFFFQLLLLSFNDMHCVY